MLLKNPWIFLNTDVSSGVVYSDCTHWNLLWKIVHILAFNRSLYSKIFYIIFFYLLRPLLFHDFFPPLKSIWCKNFPSKLWIINVYPSNCMSWQNWDLKKRKFFWSIHFWPGTILVKLPDWLEATHAAQFLI